MVYGEFADGRRAWQSDELRWGLWGTRESELRLLDGFGSGDDAIELGCGSGSVSAWLARHRLRPVAIDFSRSQIRAAESFQEEFGAWFPTSNSNAERVSYEDESFDLAISEYGASLWCGPAPLAAARHIACCARRGRLVFATVSPLLVTCTPADGISR